MVEEARVFEIRSSGFESKIPATWELSRFDKISEVTDYVANGSFATLKEKVSYKKYKDFAILVRLTDNNNNWSGDYIYIEKSAYDFLSKSNLTPGDIVIANVGDPGRVFRVPDLKQPMTLGPNSVLIKPKNGIDKGCFSLFFMSAWGQDLIRRITTGTAQKKFNKTGLRSIVVPIPPLAEQQRIVSKIEELFSDLDAGEASLRKVQKLLATYRQAVLKAAFTGELIGVDGSKWEESRLAGLIADIRYGTAKKCARDESKTPVLRIPNVVTGEIDLSDLKHTDFTASELSKLALKSGDLLIVRSNGSASLVARSALVGKEAEGFAYAGYLLRLRLKPEKILPQFLHLYFHSPAARSRIESQARSTSGVHNINSDEVKNLLLRLPSLDEQAETVDKVEEILSQINTLETWCATELKRSGTLRQAILKAAFSGQLVPQDPTDEPASVLLERIRAERAAQGQSQPGGRGRRRKAEAVPDAAEAVHEAL